MNFTHFVNISINERKRPVSKQKTSDIAQIISLEISKTSDEILKMSDENLKTSHKNYSKLQTKTKNSSQGLFISSLDAPKI